MDETLKVLGELAKPATVLIERISDAIGGIFRPWQIRRIAEAEAEAEKIRAISHIEITELQHRAMQRFFIEEANKQKNIESITSLALPMLNNYSDPSKMDTDWIINFFDKCRLISDKEMQILWSRILADEANTPGTFSKRAISIMTSMDKPAIEALTSLSNFCMTHGYEVICFIYDWHANIYTTNGLKFPIISDLESIGLVQYNQENYRYRCTHHPLDYFGKKIFLEENGIELFKTGKVVLTSTGQELIKICESKQIDGFAEYVINVLEQEHRIKVI